MVIHVQKLCHTFKDDRRDGNGTLGPKGGFQVRSIQ